MSSAPGTAYDPHLHAFTDSLDTGILVAAATGDLRMLAPLRRTRRDVAPPAPP